MGVQEGLGILGGAHGVPWGSLGVSWGDLRALDCVVGSQRGLVKGVLTGDPPESPGGKPFTPGKPPGFHPPDLRIR